MSPTIAECLEHARQCECTRLGPMMKRTVNSCFGRRSIGRSWPLRKSWKFGPLLGLLHKSLGRAMRNWVSHASSKPS